MDPILMGVLAASTLILLLLIGMPVAFALGTTAIVFLLIENGSSTFLCRG